jgi:hypothetical protein
VTCYTQPCKPCKVTYILHCLPQGGESSPRGSWGICARALPEVLTYSYILDKYILSTWINKKDKILFYKRMFLHNLNNCTSIPSEVNNSSIKKVEDRVHPTMSILTAAQVMTDKSNHHMLVKEGKSAKYMSSTKLWSKSKKSNKIASKGDGLVDTEYSLHNNYCSVRTSDEVWWVMDLSHVQ